MNYLLRHDRGHVMFTHTK